VAPDLTADTEDLEVVVARLLAATGLAQERQAQLQRALDTRILIEQAKGMLAERLGVGVQDAFEILRGAARSNRLRVHDVARRVVEGDPAVGELLSPGR
jgi:AmiR/NasT family two-component response regulator